MTSFERISTKDKLEIQGLVYTPEKPTNRVVLHVHGMAGNFYENRFLDFIARTLTANDIAFACFNNRGHDLFADLRKTDSKKEEFVRIGDANEIFEECVFDIEAQIDFLESKGYTEIFLSGHSLGAAKTAYYQALRHDIRVKGIIFESATDMLGLAKKEKDYKEMTSVSKQMINEGKGNELLPKIIWDSYWLTAKTYLSLSGEDSGAAIFNIAEQKPSILDEIKIPILAVIGGKDEIIIKSANEDLEVIKKLAKNSSNVSLRVVDESSHSYFGHEQELADALLNWIKDTA